MPMPAPTPMSATWGAVCPNCGAKYQVPKQGESAAPDEKPKANKMPSADVTPMKKPAEEKPKE